MARRRPWGDQVARSDGGRGGDARRKQATHRSAIGTDLLVSRVRRAGERALYLVSRSHLTMAKLEG